jgi:hypothetical protein
MSSPGHALRVARACAREVGKETTYGPVSVHGFGPNDQAPMLSRQMQICQSRFESLIGERSDVEHPLRFFVFGKRTAFEAFLRRILLSCGSLDGVYTPWSTRTITMTTDLPTYRLIAPERSVRTLLAYFYLDACKGCPSPLWLQVGIANVLASGGDDGELARLNRKMLSAEAGGTLLGSADLFHAHPRAMVSLLRNWQDLGNFVKYMQLTHQPWSVAEFLCRDVERRKRFRAFLKDARAKGLQEEVFTRHFGHGFDRLLEDWRMWVLDRGIGNHAPPPLQTRETLIEAVIPLVTDCRANPLERIQAIREMGRTGYVLGADVLIQLLGADDQIPSEELIWSLEAISGLALGDDREGWEDWWKSLSSEATVLA